MSDKEVMELTRRCWRGELDVMDYSQTLSKNGIQPADLRRILRRDFYWFLFKCGLVVAGVGLLAWLAVVNTPQ